MLATALALLAVVPVSASKKREVIQYPKYAFIGNPWMEANKKVQQHFFDKYPDLTPLESVTVVIQCGNDPDRLSETVKQVIKWDSHPMEVWAVVEQTQIMISAVEELDDIVREFGMRVHFLGLEHDASPSLYDFAALHARTDYILHVPEPKLIRSIPQLKDLLTEQEPERKILIGFERGRCPSSARESETGKRWSFFGRDMLSYVLVDGIPSNVHDALIPYSHDYGGIDTCVVCLEGPAQKPQYNVNCQIFAAEEQTERVNVELSVYTGSPGSFSGATSDEPQHSVLLASSSTALEKCKEDAESNTRICIPGFEDGPSPWRNRMTMMRNLLRHLCKIKPVGLKVSDLVNEDYAKLAKSVWKVYTSVPCRRAQSAGGGGIP